MLRDGLFTKAYGGTKAQIEHYIETFVKGLNLICDSPSSEETDSTSLNKPRISNPSKSVTIPVVETIPTDVKVYLPYSFIVMIYISFIP